jgi:hypothetical protein
MPCTLDSYFCGPNRAQRRAATARRPKPRRFKGSKAAKRAARMHRG